MGKKKYSFRVSCNHCKTKIVDSEEISKKETQIIKHWCNHGTDFEVIITKFKEGVYIK